MRGSMQSERGARKAKYCRFDRMTERSRDVGTDGIATAARGQQQPIAGQRLAVAQLQVEAAFRPRPRIFHSFSSDKPHSGHLCFREETGDHRFR